MTKDRVIFGVIDRENDLLGRQSDIDRVQRRPNHRNGEEALQIARGVPVHHGDGLAFTKPLADQKRSQTGNPFVKNPVGPRLTASIDDHLIRIASGRRMQDLPNVQVEAWVHG